MPRLVLVSELPAPAGGPPTAAALAVAACHRRRSAGGADRGRWAPSRADDAGELLGALARGAPARGRSRLPRARGRLASVPVAVAEGWDEELVATLALLGRRPSRRLSRCRPALLRQVLARPELGVERGSPVRRAAPAAGARRARGRRAAGRGRRGQGGATSAGAGGRPARARRDRSRGRCVAAGGAAGGGAAPLAPATSPGRPPRTGPRGRDRSGAAAGARRRSWR